MTIHSNIVTGELTDAVTAEKTAVSDGYAQGGTAVYAVSIVNTGDVPMTGLTVTDDLGGYAFGGGTVYPLACREDTLRLFVNGVLQPAPTVVSGPPMVVTGIDVPAGGSAVLIYETDVTAYAPLEADGSIVNTAVITGGGAPVTASAELPYRGETALTITKSMSPDAVAPGEELTYTFVIRNTGTEPVHAADAVSVSDTFAPVLRDLTADLDGAALTAPADYTYDPSTGVFTTVPARITVPGAAASQGEDGVWTLVPGATVLTVTGTV